MDEVEVIVRKSGNSIDFRVPKRTARTSRILSVRSRDASPPRIFMPRRTRTRTLTRYLADTYAFIEAFTGNPRYARILRSGQVVTTAANVLELHYSLLRREVPTEEAERLSRATLRLVVG